MPGFLVSDFEKKVELHNYASYCRKDEMACSSYWMKRNTLNKYLQDKIFCQNEDYVLILEGVILNKAELCNQYGAELSQVIVRLYEEMGNEFPKVLRGSFSGAVYEKKADRWILYTDQIGTKPLY